MTTAAAVAAAASGMAAAGAAAEAAGAAAGHRRADCASPSSNQLLRMIGTLTRSNSAVFHSHGLGSGLVALNELQLSRNTMAKPGVSLDALSSLKDAPCPVYFRGALRQTGAAFAVPWHLAPTVAVYQLVMAHKLKSVMISLMDFSWVGKV